MIDSAALATLRVIAANLGVNQSDLYKLIKFESGWNPRIKNPRSSARGLIQFTDKTARSLGYRDSLDLVAQHPTVTSQLPVVYRYLSQFKPFTGKQSLYLSVFYPVARYWSPGRSFPQFVRSANPGINTPADYVNKVEDRKGSGLLLLPVIIGAGFLIYSLTRRKV